MSSTNKTLTIELSQYVGTDKPTYLSDYNGDMLKIDSAIAADRDSIATAQSKADGADAKADTNAGAISDLDSQINNASNGLTKRVTDVEGDVNTIESLIGNGTPTTSDKTIIGAINELNAEMPSATPAATSVTYDNTTSGLVATNVQSAIDELASKAPTTEDEFGALVDLTTYNSTSPYTAPADGYAYVYADGTSGAQARVTVTDGTTAIMMGANGLSGESAVNSMFVKKGLKLYGTVSGGSGNARFYPLV